MIWGVVTMLNNSLEQDRENAIGGYFPFTRLNFLIHMPRIWIRDSASLNEVIKSLLEIF